MEDDVEALPSVLPTTFDWYKLNLNARPTLSYSYAPSGASMRFAHQENPALYSLRNLKWSPDGSSLSAISSLQELLLFKMPSDVWHHADKAYNWTPEHVIEECEPIYDTAWKPLTNTLDATSNSLIISTKDHPTRLVNTTTLETISTYCAYDQKDELVAPVTLSFNTNGSLIFGGFENAVRIFDTSRPGSQFDVLSLTPTRRSSEGIKGVVSSICFNGHGIFAVGTYNNMIGLYGEVDHCLIMALSTPQSRGVSHLWFSVDGVYLFSSGRSDDYILCWDLRSIPKVLFGMPRKITSQQRTAFSLDATGQVIMAGDDSGDILCFDILSDSIHSSLQSFPEKPAHTKFKAHLGSITCIACHPVWPLAASCSRLPHASEVDAIENLSDEEKGGTTEIGSSLNYEEKACLHLWQLPHLIERELNEH